MTKEEVFQVLVLIEMVYPYCSVKDETVVNWFRKGTGVDFKKVVDRLMVHFRNSPYPPTLRELLNVNDSDSWIREYSPRKRVNH